VFVFLPTLTKARIISTKSFCSGDIIHYGCVPGLYPEENYMVTAFIRSATPTNFIAGPLLIYIVEYEHYIQIAEFLNKPLS